jgi:hypothetical protein
MSGRQWFVMQENSILGPIGSTELRNLAFSGKLQRDAKVSLDREKWHPASAVRGLLPASSDSRPQVDASPTTAVKPLIAEVVKEDPTTEPNPRTRPNLGREASAIVTSFVCLMKNALCYVGFTVQCRQRRQRVDEATFALGRRMYQLGLGDRALILKIAELTEQIEGPKRTTAEAPRLLVRDRQRLTARLAESALPDPKCQPSLEGEYAGLRAAQVEFASSVRGRDEHLSQIKHAMQHDRRRVLTGFGLVTAVGACVLAVWFVAGGRSNDSLPPHNVASVNVAQASPLGEAGSETTGTTGVAHSAAEVLRLPWSPPTNRPKVGVLQMGMSIHELPPAFEIIGTPTYRGDESQFLVEPEIRFGVCNMPQQIDAPSYVDSVLAFFAGERLYKVVYKTKLVYSDLSPEMRARMGVPRNLTRAEANREEADLVQDIMYHYSETRRPFVDPLEFKFQAGRLSPPQVEQLKMALLAASGSSHVLNLEPVNGGVRCPMVYAPFADNKDEYWRIFKGSDLMVALEAQPWDTLGRSDDPSGTMKTRWLITYFIWEPLVNHFGLEYALNKSYEIRMRQK